MKKYSIGFAYPSSDLAEQYNCRDSGCWTISRQCKEVAGGFATFSEALAALGELIDGPIELYAFNERQSHGTK